MAHLTRCAVWSDPSCSITYFDDRDMVKYGYDNEDAFIAWYTDRLKQVQMQGFTFTLVDRSNLPSDRTRRAEWSLIQGEVKVDPDKAAAKNQKKSEVSAILEKLKISEEELKKLKGWL